MMEGIQDGNPAGLLKKIEELQRKVNELETDRNLPATRAVESEFAPISEADMALRRLVQRIAMILQAEKIVIMFFDRESGELMAIPPAIGVDDQHLKVFRVRASTGLSGQVFRDSESVIFHDAMHDPRTQMDPFALLHVHNGVTVPLVIEKRDEQNRVTERNTIGVLHAFNKRDQEEFNDEDVRLLERMAKNVGSIIANIQLYKEVVEQKEELAQTFESLSAGLMLVSPEGRLSQLNSSARAVFQLTADAIGKSARDQLRNDDLWAVINDASRGIENTKRDITVMIGGSERIYEVQAAQVRGEENKDLGVVAILNDITDMKNIDRMKSSFVAMASHELRTPLTAIKGFSSTLLDGVDDDLYGKEEQKEFLGIVVSECDRLRRLIDDLLNTSRIEAGESLKPNYSEFELMPLLEKVVRVQQQSTTKHAVSLKVRGELPKTIVGDEDKFDQILTNLLNNAIKYSPNGGDVYVHATLDGDHVLFGVQDHGLGIPKDHLAKVFEKFHRVNNEDNRKIYGTGLGLFLVKHLVEQVHMGKIWADSEVGKGSTFLFRMPARIDIEEAKRANE
ncbi:MAG: ATP-binding protein [Fimbriimonadaceae bacterium]|nr:ATP-binding protein [Fimbriimonadaceae bacterium]